MQKKNQVVKRIFILIGCLTVHYSLFYCDGSDKVGNIICDIEMEQMAQLNLPDFSLLRESSIDSLRTEYVFYRMDDSVKLFITLGLYHSEQDVQDVANNYVNSISLYLDEGPHQGVSIGNKFWWDTGSDPDVLTDIVFTRKNALFIMNSRKYEDLKTLAIKIDNDIFNKESYIIFQN